MLESLSGLMLLLPEGLHEEAEGIHEVVFQVQVGLQLRHQRRIDSRTSLLNNPLLRLADLALQALDPFRGPGQIVPPFKEGGLLLDEPLLRFGKLFDDGGDLF